MCGAIDCPSCGPAQGYAWPPVSEDALADAAEKWLTKIDANDVLDQLCDCADLIDAATKKPDAAARIGAIYMAARNAYAMRLAERDLFDGEAMTDVRGQVLDELMVFDAQAEQDTTRI